MSDQPTASERCPRCGARWSRSGHYWLVTDVHGRLTLPPATEEKLAQCPVCKARVTPGKVTVTEEKG